MTNRSSVVGGGGGSRLASCGPAFGSLVGGLEAFELLNIASQVGVSPFGEFTVSPFDLFQCGVGG